MGATQKISTHCPDAFARAVAALLERPELCLRMGLAGHRCVIERFAQAGMCEAYARLFLDLAER